MGHQAKWELRSGDLCALSPSEPGVEARDPERILFQHSLERNGESENQQEKVQRGPTMRNTH